ncbi:Kinase D-interacting substrate [Phytophthora citrophthora]|uniref:Kinase D-interacting substrate n=1 Tax=Phytophthora citrophthora TaxID=4793 RepID=A0AAD9GTB3_9STRA|nr:Kinase D-interacting substrate [Phytophthora citrophthora]
MLTVCVLVENGADISSCDKRGWTPLHHAAAGGFGPVMKALTARGAPLDSKTNSGYTAEMLAMQGGYSDAVKFSTMDGPNDPGFEKYKEYLLDDMDINLTSITQVEQEGS